MIAFKSLEYFRDAGVIGLADPTDFAAQHQLAFIPCSIYTATSHLLIEYPACSKMARISRSAGPFGATRSASFRAAITVNVPFDMLQGPENQ